MLTSPSSEVSPFSSDTHDARPGQLADGQREAAGALIAALLYAFSFGVVDAG